MSLLCVLAPREITRAFDGGLPRVARVRTSEVFRADVSREGEAGWSYNHAPMLAHFAGRFWLSFLSSPRDEHAAPCCTRLFSSRDGENWDDGQTLFPAFPDDAARVIMHQRCGFYHAPNGVFLALGFYGVVSGADGPPFGDHGLGRVARQIFPDGTLGPIYFLRVNARPIHALKPQFPLWSEADSGFQNAAKVLLSDRLKTLEWWDEELHDPAFFAHANCAHDLSAVSLFERENGQRIGIGKWGRVIVSDDDGKSWRSGGVLEGVPTNGAKVWAQRIRSGEWVLVFNPTSDNNHRYPLALATSRDGLHFENLRCVVGDVPPQRYAGRFKDVGPQYVRGIEAGNAPDGALYLTYSMNKEDIWFARVEV